MRRSSLTLYTLLAGYKENRNFSSFQTWILAVSFLAYATCVPPSCTEGSLCVSRLQKLQVVQQAQRHIVALSCSLQALYCLKSR